MAEPTTPSLSDQFFDRWTELFLRGFGPFFQAGILRTGNPPREDPEQSVLALADRAGIQDGDRILDAGCGVAGPAMVIAAHYPNVAIDGITISAVQATMAGRRVEAAALASRLRVHVADYQQLPFRPARFDQVLFFESTGYATDLVATYDEAFRVLRPGGRLYVKDVFCMAGHLQADEREQMNAFDQLWGCVRSKTMDESLGAIGLAGFEVSGSAPMPNLGTSRLLGSMFEFNPASGLRPSELGDAFWRKGLRPPIVFGEITAVRPNA